MWEYIDENIKKFKDNFRCEAAFGWFVVIIVGLMVREDHLGVTSIIRALGLNPEMYETMVHFFRATSWRLSEIKKTWIKIVYGSGLVYSVCGRPLQIGDGVKASKEGRKMPGVKKLAQESENSGKAAYIHGHMFGGIGVLIGTPMKWFCTLLSLRLHDGNEVIGKWQGEESAEDSHVVRMINEACEIAGMTKPSLLALDRYYLTVPALEALGKNEEKYGAGLVSVVTKAKMNAKAYTKPEVRKGPGRPLKKGEAVKVRELFGTEVFKKAELTIYGKKQTVEFAVVNLLWGDKLYRELRFVLVKNFNGGKDTILVSTDLTLSPEQIIEIYAFRFKIECSFRELKQVISGFSYRFWSKAMPKLSRYAKNEKMSEQLNAIHDEKQKSAIINAFNAIEAFAMFSVIAFGLIQMVSLLFSNEINASAFRWLRTNRNQISSEATTAHFLRNSFFHCLRFFPHFLLSRFIFSKQSPPFSSNFDAPDSSVHISPEDSAG
jgi:hypothetical protein